MHKKNVWHELFELGILVKGFNGIWETITGSVFLLVSKDTLGSWFFLLTHNELLEHPKDRLFDFLAQFIINFPADLKVFAALYILAHGLLNLFLAIQLYQNKHWAYLVTITTNILFIIYQVHRIFTHHSRILTVITIFDAIFVVLAWHEYQYHKNKDLTIPLQEVREA